MAANYDIRSRHRVPVVDTLTSRSTACRESPRGREVVLKGPRNRLTETDVLSGIREVSRRNISRGIPFREAEKERRTERTMSAA